MHDKEFRAIVYEIAFGDNAINKGYSDEEVLESLTFYAESSAEFDDIIAAVKEYVIPQSKKLTLNYIRKEKHA